jgi:hypothetical protein
MIEIVSSLMPRHCCNLLTGNDLKVAKALANKSFRIQKLEWNIEAQINKFWGEKYA